jgi:membrane fusion protein (multidrug efflux system)
MGTPSSDSTASPNTRLSGQPAPDPAATPAPAQAPRPHKPRIIVAVIGLVALAAIALAWLGLRLTRSETEDAFIEAHIVNVAPEVVSGHICRIMAEENEHVEKGQILAEIDPVPYRDKVALAQSKVDEAKAELRRQETGQARVKLEVPIQIAIAQRSLAAAEADQARAKESLRLTADEVDKGIQEAKAGLDLAKADLVLAQQEYERFTALYKREVVPLERSQQATRSRDVAEAQKKLAEAKLAKAEAGRTEVDVARRTMEAAEKNMLKAIEGVNLAQTGKDQIVEMEDLTALKKEMVKEAERGLVAAEDELKYTRIRAPFPGVVVKLYRHLGDFASAGVPLLSMYNHDMLYVTANLEETRLPGVEPGNQVTLDVDAFSQPFRGRVVWINKSTGAQFALMPRNVVSGEFTKVVQRVPVRIWIEKDDRWPQLRAGLSVHAVIGHGPGDAEWANRTALEFAEFEAQFNAPLQADADKQP